MADRAPGPSVAVCLAAYNGSHWLDEQLDSILAQREVRPTVFISVDRSEDGTEGLVDRRAAADARLVVLPHGQRFGSAAQNFFRLLREVDFSAFDYVCFSDQDDIWLPDKLRRAIDAGAAAAADAVSSNVVAFWPDGRERLIRKDQPMGRWNHLFESAGPGCTYVLKAALAARLGAALRENAARASEVALHDWMIYAWTVAHGFRWHIDAYPGLRYRQHGANEFGANFGVRAIRSRWRRLVDGWYRHQVLNMAELAGAADSPPIRRLSRLAFVDRIALALQVAQLRRHVRDRLVLAAALLVMPR